MVLVLEAQDGAIALTSSLEVALETAAGGFTHVPFMNIQYPGADVEADIAMEH